MITIKNYVKVQSLDEAYELNKKKRNRIIGGMLWLKMSSIDIDTAIDMCGLGLDTVEETDDRFDIGTMVTLRQLEKHEGLNKYMNGAAEKAFRDIVGVQFRNLATVGGSLWSRFGFSDVLTLLLSADCSVELYNGGTIPLEQFARMKPDNDIIVRIIIKKTPGRFTYSVMRNQSTDIPALNCAISDIGGEYRAVYGARPGRAVLLRDTNGILSGGLTADKIKEFAEYASDSVTVGGNNRGSGRYRQQLIRVFTERGLNEIGGLG